MNNLPKAPQCNYGNLSIQEMDIEDRVKRLEKPEIPQNKYKITCPKCFGTGRTNKFFQCSRCKGSSFIEIKE